MSVPSEASSSVDVAAVPASRETEEVTNSRCFSLRDPFDFSSVIKNFVEERRKLQPESPSPTNGKDLEHDEDVAFHTPTADYEAEGKTDLAVVSHQPYPGFHFNPMTFASTALEQGFVQFKHQDKRVAVIASLFVLAAMWLSQVLREHDLHKYSEVVWLSIVITFSIVIPIFAFLLLAHVGPGRGADNRSALVETTFAVFLTVGLFGQALTSFHHQHEKYCVDIPNDCVEPPTLLYAWSSVLPLIVPRIHLIYSIPAAVFVGLILSLGTSETKHVGFPTDFVSIFLLTAVIYIVLFAVFATQEALQRKLYRMYLLLSQETAAIQRDSKNVAGILEWLLPPVVMTRVLKNEAAVDARVATVLVADVHGFTAWCSDKSSYHVVKLLTRVMGRFDEAAVSEGVLRVKLIGDGYVAVCGLVESSPVEDHAVRAVRLANAMHSSMKSEDLGLRVGIHSGFVVGAMLSRQRWAYDIYGSSLRVASALEPECPTQNTLVSGTTRRQLPLEVRELLTRYQSVIVDGARHKTYVLGLDVETPTLSYRSAPHPREDSSNKQLRQMFTERKADRLTGRRPTVQSLSSSGTDSETSSWMMRSKVDTVSQTETLSMNADEVMVPQVVVPPVLNGPLFGMKEPSGDASCELPGLHTMVQQSFSRMAFSSAFLFAGYLIVTWILLGLEAHQLPTGTAFFQDAFLLSLTIATLLAVCNVLLVPSNVLARTTTALLTVSFAALVITSPSHSRYSFQDPGAMLIVFSSLTFLVPTTQLVSQLALAFQFILLLVVILLKSPRRELYIALPIIGLFVASYLYTNSLKRLRSTIDTIGRTFVKVMEEREVLRELLSMKMPEHVVEELMVRYTHDEPNHRRSWAIYHQVDNAVVAFCRFYTPMESTRSDVTAFIESQQAVMTVVDRLLPANPLNRRHQHLERIKSVGDIILVAGHLLPGCAVSPSVLCAEMRGLLIDFDEALSYPGNTVQFSCGVHIGPITTAVIGTQQLEFDVYGTTVNTASRVMSTMLKLEDVVEVSPVLRSEDVDDFQMSVSCEHIPTVPAALGFWHRSWVSDEFIHVVERSLQPDEYAVLASTEATVKGLGLLTLHTVSFAPLHQSTPMVFPA